MKTGTIRLWAGIAGIQSMLAASGLAAVFINVDFQPGGTGGGTSVTFSGQGALAAPGSTWNAVAPSTDGSNNGMFGSGGQFDFSGDPYVSSYLVDSVGSTTGVRIEVYKGDPDSAFALNPLNGFDVNIADNAKALMRDYLISGWGTDPNSINIVGIPTGSAYTVYLYGAGDNDSVSTKFTINGTDHGTTGVPNGSHNLTLGQDYVVVSGVASNGSITISYMNNGETADGHFNGLQLTYTPPNSIPTLSEWGMIIAALVLLAVGARQLAQRSAPGLPMAPA